ncbi:Rv3654c family TadE-like protein [Pseudoclavibacter sp. RFBA6]|uniref:Rv3654c family TadE-like protein n=1 Tax=Pseudoclavibacter sp. RFBA6 TaxID=2080573 RepID=UPI000CE8D80C|nr:Rv3654c family TadE-like protein [Pseudoclavibacter sp. RFBA6]PPG42233.1 helicase [Pseudoclavibacter sp. RFBA6]
MSAEASAPPRNLGGERGAGGVVMLAVSLLLLALTVGAVNVLSAFPAKQTAHAAADAGALAAADVASGLKPGDPCEEAARVVTANGASLEACTVSGREAVVRVRVESGPFVFSEPSRAGPPPR